MPDSEINNPPWRLRTGRPLPMPRRESRIPLKSGLRHDLLTGNQDAQEISPPEPPRFGAEPARLSRIQEESPEPVESAAAAIADNRRLWRALLFAHQPDRHSRCITCTDTAWPCGPRALAERAEQIHYSR
jgi:hypothetical protein